MDLIKKTKGFTVLANEILNRKDLSLKAKGLFAYLMSKPDNWHFSVNGAKSQNKDGTDSVRSGIKELEQKGYLIRKSKKNQLGQFTGYDYYIYDEPHIVNPSTEQPINGKSINGKQGNHSNTIISNKEKVITNIESADLFGNKIDVLFLPDDILKYLNLKLQKRFPSKRGFGFTDSNLSYIKARLKEKKVKYTMKDFQAVIDWKISEWSDKEKTKKWLRPSTLFGDKFDQYLTEAMESNIKDGNDWGNDNFVESASTEKDLI